MKLIEFAIKAHFSPAFLPEIPPGNFLFLPEISKFTLRQFFHETRKSGVVEPGQLGPTMFLEDYAPSVNATTFDGRNL